MRLYKSRFIILTKFFQVITNCGKDMNLILNILIIWKWNIPKACSRRKVVELRTIVVFLYILQLVRQFCLVYRIVNFNYKICSSIDKVQHCKTSSYYHVWTTKIRKYQKNFHNLYEIVLNSYEPLETTYKIDIKISIQRLELWN